MLKTESLCFSALSLRSAANIKPRVDPVLSKQEMVWMTSFSEASLLIITQLILIAGLTNCLIKLFKVPYKIYSLTDNLDRHEILEQCAMTRWSLERG